MVPFPDRKSRIRKTGLAQAWTTSLTGHGTVWGTIKPLRQGPPWFPHIQLDRHGQMSQMSHFAAVRPEVLASGASEHTSELPFCLN